MNPLNSWKKLILGCTIGNVLELYDFILYAYFSKIIGSFFFPTEDPFIATLLAFSVFATGAAMRPVGAIALGWIGDRVGRKEALVLSVGLMTFSTCLIGVLPTYESIGLLAPSILIVSRLLQGFSMCGEEVGAAIYLMESAPRSQKCFAGSIILGSVYLGLMMASIIAFITVTLIDDTTLNAWGWRIPFLLALPFGCFALYIRLKQPETKKFKTEKNHVKSIQNPIKLVFKQHYLKIINGTIATSLFAVMVYLYAVYLPSYVISHFDFGLSGAMLINIVSFSLTTIVTLITGRQSDKIGYKRIMQYVSISTFILITPVFILLSTNTILNVILSIFLMSILTGMAAGSIMPFLFYSFPTLLRFIGSAIIFNLSMTVFGSSAPIIILYLSEGAKLSILPATYIMLIALVSYCATVNLKKWKLKEKVCRSPL